MPHLDDDQLESLLRQTKPDLPSFSAEKKRQLRVKLLAQASQNRKQQRSMVVWQRAFGLAGALMLFVVPAYFWLVQATAQNGGTVASFIPLGRWASEEPTAVYPTPTSEPNALITDEVLGPPRLDPALTEQAYPPPLPPNNASLSDGYPPPNAIGQTAEVWFRTLQTEDNMIALELMYQVTNTPAVGYVELSSSWGTNGRYTAQYPIEQNSSTISAKVDIPNWQIGEPIIINAKLFVGSQGNERLAATAVPYQIIPNQQLWLQQQRTLEQTADAFAFELLVGYQRPATYASVEFQLKTGQTIIARQIQTSPIGLIHLPLILPKTDADTLLVGELYGQTATGELVLLETLSWSLK